MNLIGGVMFNMHALNAVDRMFEAWSGQCGRSYV
jgi:hypothetical protein